jgi:hypothetical protein
LTSTRRFLVAAAAGVFSLAFAGTSFAAYGPSLLVAGTNHALSRGAPVVIGVGQDENDDATAMATIYSPPGYRVNLAQPAGTTLGSLSGVVKVGSLGGARVNVEGTVKTDNPANHVTNPCSPGTHEAVWLLEFTLQGNAFRVPMYVDRVTTAPESAYASARMRVCFPSPYVPAPQGAPAGASMVVSAFSVRSVFTNPGARGGYAWNGVFVPYTPGTAIPNAPNTAQSTSFVRLPVRLTMTARRQRRGGRTFAVVSACVTEAGQGVRGIRIAIVGAPTAGRANSSRARRVAGGTTNARGCIRTRVRLRTRSLFLRATSAVPARQAPGCQPTIVPRCSQPSIAPAFDLSSGRAKRVRR